MIRYDAENGVVIMDLDDLLLCEFSRELFAYELLHVTTPTDLKAARNPVAVMVNYVGGYTPVGDDARFSHMREEAREKFEALLARVRGDDADAVTNLETSCCPECGAPWEYMYLNLRPTCDCTDPHSQAPVLGPNDVGELGPPEPYHPVPCE